MNEQVKFYRGNESSLDNVIPENGALYHCDDTGNTYIGINGKLELYSTKTQV